MNETSSSEEETSSSDEPSTDPESESGKSGQSAASDHHGTKRRGEFDEEKLVSNLNYKLKYQVIPCLKFLFF